MSDLRALVNEMHEAHTAAHGPRCGVVHGRWANNPCVILRRAWVSLYREEAAREHSLAYRAAHPGAAAAASAAWRSRNPGAGAAATAARNARWRMAHLEAARAQGAARGRAARLLRKQAAISEQTCG